MPYQARIPAVEAVQVAPNFTGQCRIGGDVRVWRVCTLAKLALRRSAIHPTLLNTSIARTAKPQAAGLSPHGLRLGQKTQRAMDDGPIVEVVGAEVRGERIRQRHAADRDRPPCEQPVVARDEDEEQQGQSAVEYPEAEQVLANPLIWLPPSGGVLDFFRLLANASRGEDEPAGKVESR